MLDCTSRPSVMLPAHNISKLYFQVLFGWDSETDTDPILLCQKHFGRLRNKHGRELGYTMRNGKPVRYIKGSWF